MHSKWPLAGSAGRLQSGTIVPLFLKKGNKDVCLLTPIQLHLSNTIQPFVWIFVLNHQIYFQIGIKRSQSKSEFAVQYSLPVLEGRYTLTIDFWIPVLENVLECMDTLSIK